MLEPNGWNSVDINDPSAIEILTTPVNSLIHSLVFSLEGRAWQEPEPSHVTGMALAHCILGKFLGVVGHCFPLPLDVPTLASVRNDARDPSSERWNCE